MKIKNISIAISSCPNDIYIFYAILTNKIDTQNIKLNFTIHDIEHLNNLVINNSIDIAKISFAAYPFAIDNYILSNVGSAITNDGGPLLIGKDNQIHQHQPKVGIPGKYTTANLLLSKFFNFNNTVELLFSEIEDKIIDNSIDIGVIIHESRFSYQNKGLKLITNLGNLWINKTNLPIPLGGIAINRKIDNNTSKKIQSLITKSINYAKQNHNEVVEYAKKFSYIKNNDTINQHIEMYVNEYTYNLNTSAKNSIIKLLNINNNLNIFL